MRNWFKNKTIIVSGASSGIGKGIVERLILDHGCTVIGIGRSEGKMLEVKKDLGDKADKFSYYLFDVSTLESWLDFADTIKKEGIKPDILINNAGILPRFDKFANYSFEEIDKAMKINFYSCAYSIKCMMPILLESDSAGIINIASSAALCSLAGTSIYSASKAALKGMTESLREEYKDQCYVGLVFPGFTKTDIFREQKAEKEEGVAERAIEMISMPCKKMVNKIIHGMEYKRSNMVFGIDAKLMNDGRRYFGRITPMISSSVMKRSGAKLFESVFDD